MLIQEKFVEKRNSRNRTAMAGKMVIIVHVSLIKELKRNAVFVIKMMIILQQLVQEEQKLFSIVPARNMLK